MLENEELEKFLNRNSDIIFTKVEGDGYQYHLTIVSNVFADLSKVKRQKWVYQQLNDYITSGQLHALNMKTYSQDEWENING